MKNGDYEPQFPPGVGKPKVRREIDRINRVVSKMLAAGISKQEIDFLVNCYKRSGERWARFLELDRRFNEELATRRFHEVIEQQPKEHQ